MDYEQASQNKREKKEEEKNHQICNKRLDYSCESVPKQLTINQK